MVAAETQRMHREYHQWYSPALDRNMELLVLGHSGTRVLVFPTRMGRFFDYENFQIHEGIRDRIEAGWLQLYCVDSLDCETFYCSARRPADRIRRHQQFENYLLEEVIPFSEERNPEPLIAHGCSLGAYHAVNLALRHPEKFVKILALSGRYDLTWVIGDFPDLLDGYHDEMVYFHMPSQYLSNLNDPTILDAIRRLHIVLAVGEADPFLGSNHLLHQQLCSRGARVELHTWAGRAHKAPYWREMVRCYL